MFVLKETLDAALEKIKKLERELEFQKAGLEGMKRIIREFDEVILTGTPAVRVKMWADFIRSNFTEETYTKRMKEVLQRYKEISE